MSKFWGPFTQAPNLLILMTDQQRSSQHYPPGWAERYLPNLAGLMRGGVSFPNAMTNATACSPSRAVLWTGTYAPVNGVVGNQDDLSSQLGKPVQTGPQPGKLPLSTLGLMLGDPTSVLRYDVVYKGKWHLQASYQRGTSSAAQQLSPQEALQASDNADMDRTYGFGAWTSPDFGTCMQAGQPKIPAACVNTLGGGAGGNDARVATGTSYASGMPDEEVESAATYLAKRFAGAPPERPFCLITSLVGPHDIFVSPRGYCAAGYDDSAAPWRQAPYTAISECPPTFRLSPAQLANKPAAQAAWRSGLSAEDALDYLRFYAYLQVQADRLLGEVLAALPAEQRANTLIVQLADHGEMGMSQGGMWEKESQAYNETLLVPMVFANPGLPQGQVCTALAGLIDIVPTLAEICGLGDLHERYAIQGKSLASALLTGSAGSTYPQALFTSDGPPLRALIDNDQLGLKYVVTGNGKGWQYELYPFVYTPGITPPRPLEADNLIPVDGPAADAPPLDPSLRTRWQQMHAALTEAMQCTHTTPAGWPSKPPLA